MNAHEDLNASILNRSYNLIMERIWNNLQSQTSGDVRSNVQEQVVRPVRVMLAFIVEDEIRRQTEECFR